MSIISKYSSYDSLIDRFTSINNNQLMQYACNICNILCIACTWVIELIKSNSWIFANKFLPTIKIILAVTWVWAFLGLQCTKVFEKFFILMMMLPDYWFAYVTTTDITTTDNKLIKILEVSNTKGEITNKFKLFLSKYWEKITDENGVHDENGFDFSQYVKIFGAEILNMVYAIENYKKPDHESEAESVLPERIPISPNTTECDNDEGESESSGLGGSTESEGETESTGVYDYMKETMEEFKNITDMDSYISLHHMVYEISNDILEDALENTVYMSATDDALENIDNLNSAISKITTGFYKKIQYINHKTHVIVPGNTCGTLLFNHVSLDTGYEIDACLHEE